MIVEPRMAESEDVTLGFLHSFLCEELAAAASYQRAVPRLSHVGDRAVLELCEQSHAARARLLAREIERRGGLAEQSADPWQCFGTAVVAPASSPEAKERAALAALDQGEEHELKKYVGPLALLDASTRSLIEHRILPEQRRTRQAMVVLSHGDP